MILAGCTDRPQAGPPPSDPFVAQDVIVHSASERLVVRAAQARVDEEVIQGEGVRAEAPGLAIEAQRSSWSFATRQATFDGDVVAIRGETTLTCSHLSVTLGSGEQIERAVADGGVVVQQADRRATADRAVLVGASGQVVLTGGPPVLSDPLRRLAGERIVLWLDDERVECDSCKLILQGDAIGAAPGSSPPD